MRRIFISIAILILTTVSTISFADSLNRQDLKSCSCNPALYAQRKAILEQLIGYFEKRNLNGLLSLMSNKQLTFAELMGTGRVAHSKSGVHRILGDFFSHLTQDNVWDVKRIIIDTCQNTATVERVSHMHYNGNSIVMPVTAVIQFNKNNKIESYQDFSDSALFIKENKGASWLPKK